MNGLMKLECALRNELMTTVRLATGGVCSVAGLNLDDSEDCKVCVTEALLLMKHRGYTTASLTFVGGDGLTVIAEGRERDGEMSAPAEDEISAALLSALAESVVMDKREGELYKITFRFGREA